MISDAMAADVLAPVFVAFPKSEHEPGYQSLLIRTLTRACTDHHHASLTVEQLLEHCKFRPLPADVFEASKKARELREPVPEEWMPKTATCSTCNGDGFIHEDRDGGCVFARPCPECRKLIAGAAKGA